MPAMRNSELTALSPPDFCPDHWLKYGKKYRKIKRPFPPTVRVHPVAYPMPPEALPAVLPPAGIKYRKVKRPLFKLSSRLNQSPRAASPRAALAVQAVRPQPPVLS